MSAPRRALAVFVGAVACSWVSSTCAAEVPYLTGRVVDTAEILQPQTREHLSAALKAHEEKTTNQVAVLTVPTIDGESVEEYAVRVFEDWKLGRKGKDNGVLVVVVPQDRKMRIEVGYGLEGTLTDVSANRIIRIEMTPQFKTGNYDRGISDGVTAIVALLEGGAAPATNSVGEGTPPSSLLGLDDPDLPPWPVRILIGAFVFSIIGLFTFIGSLRPASDGFYTCS